jgi:hypothetical protein
VFGIEINDVIGFAIEYKWWFFALIPFGIAVMALKARG